VTALAIAVPAQAAPAGGNASARTPGSGAAKAPRIGTVPLSADQITKSNGNVTTAKLFRDSKGRTRVENGSTVTITDPAAQTTIRLDVPSGTFEQSTRKPSPRPATVEREQGPAGPMRSLGTAEIQGVRAEGRAYTVNLPAVMGLPARTKDVTMWLSTDLQLALQTRIEDSTGYLYDQSYANIRAGVEPSADLFTVPPGYRQGTPVSTDPGINASCPISNWPDPLILDTFGTFYALGFVAARTDGSIGCFFAADRGTFFSPLAGRPFYPLYLTVDDWLAGDNGALLPYVPYVTFGDIAFLVVNKDDQTVKDSLIVLTVWY
jgi:hypothetical protein